MRIKRRSMVILSALSLMLIGTVIASTLQDRSDSKLIIGTWVSEKDKNVKWVFTTAECRQYYGSRFKSYDYKVSNASPQCGKTVKEGAKHSYLSLKEKGVSGAEEQCYFINGLNDKNLSLNLFDRSTILVFDRQ